MNKDFLIKLGNHIRKMRKARKMTQDDVGIDGISRQMVSLIELARTDITTSKLKVIADNLKVRVKDLFDFE